VLNFFLLPLIVPRSPLGRALLVTAGTLTLLPGPVCTQETTETEVEAPIQVEEEIVVTATRSKQQIQEVPASVTLEDMAELERNGFYVAGDELRGQPGIFFRRGEGDNDDFLFVNVRGVIGNHGNDVFLALVDGIPFVGPDEEVLMNDIPYAVVEDIEIVRGPVSALYGRGGIAGAVNYTLRSPTDESYELRLTGGSDRYLNGRLNLSRAFGEHRVLVSLDALSADGWREHNQQERLNGFTRGLFQLDDSTALSAYINYLERNYDTGSVIPTLADGTRVDVLGGREGFLGSRDTGQERQALMSALRLSRILTSDLTFEAAGHYRESSVDNRLDFYDVFGFDPDRHVMTVNGFDTTTDSSARFAEAQMTWARGRTTTVAGANYETVTLDETDYWSGQFGFTPECGFAFFAIEIDYTTGQILNADHPCFVTRLPRLIADSENTFASAFVQSEIRISERMTLTLGGRYDEFQRRTDLTTGTPLVEQETVRVSEHHVSPKASLTYRLAPGHLVYASYGEGFSSNFGPVWQSDPSRFIRDTRPTTLENFEVGFKGSLGRNRFEYALALFSIDQRNRLVLITNPDSFIDFTAPGTIATSGQRYESQGLELTTRLRLGRGTRLQLDYSHVDASWDELILETFTGPLDLSGNAPTGVPENILQLTFDQQLGDDLDLRLAWEYYGDYYLTQDNVFRGGSYNLLNLSARYRLEWRNLDRVELSITNLLDEEYYFLFGGSRTAVTNAVPGVPLQARLTFGLRF
jgi:iron complex outermembrane receptor protein